MLGFMSDSFVAIASVAMSRRYSTFGEWMTDAAYRTSRWVVRRDSYAPFG